MRLAEPILNRFDRFIDRSGKCWNWMGSRCRGYGRILINARNCYAHRVSYALYRGATNGLLVLHRCDNPGCVRPDHLFLGTQDENMKDMKQKGRAARLACEKNPSAKLGAADVPKIQNMFASDVSISQIARHFNVSRSAIQRIVHKKGWGLGASS